MYDVPSVSPTELAEEMKGANPPVLLDVREAEELEISRLPNVVHIPLHEVPERMEELSRESEIVVICRTGGRSGQATAFLLHHGFDSVRNLAMGMNGWARTVDPSMPQY